MIKKLRLKFFINAMIAFATALLVLIVILNIFVTYRFNDVIDANLARIMRQETSGIEPPGGDDVFRGFNERMFIVKYSDEEGIIETIISSPDLITETNAQDYAIKALAEGEQRGWKDNYRYLVNRVDGVDIVIFIDGDFFMYAITSFRNISLIAFGVTIVFVAGFIYLASKKAIEPIKESQDRQKQFMTDASHELKTPLTVISANTEIAKMNDPNNEWLIGIQKQTKILTELIQQIIKMSKLDEVDFKLETSSIDIAAMIDDILDDFLVVIDHKKIELNKSYEKSLMIEAEKNSIKELFRILIDNAVKYSDELGDLNIKIEKGKKTHIYITNQYNQVSSLDTKKIFNRFYRADESRKSDGSFGLGLSIAQSIVNMHKGSIKAYSHHKNYLTIEVSL